MKQDRLEMLEAMIAQGSDDPFIWYARAMELKTRGQLSEALRAYAEVADKYASYVPTYLMAGQVAETLEQRESAREWYEKGLEQAQAAGDAHALSELRAALEAL